MTPEILAFARAVKDRYKIIPGRVLEVGSLDVNGTIRDVFQADAESYIGVDLVDGPGVDKVIKPRSLPVHFDPASFDTILCCECLEHDPTFWITLTHMKNLLRTGGTMLITTPTFGFPLHRHPVDCYRFGEDVYRSLFFHGFDILELQEVRDYLGNPIICCVGVKK